MAGAHEADDAEEVGSTTTHVDPGDAATDRSDAAHLRLVLVFLAGLVAAVVWLVVLTFPKFFLFNPFSAPTAIRKVELTLSTVGWVVLATVPSIMLVLYANGRRRAIGWMPLPALLWPVSLLLSQGTVYAQSGWWYVGYLADYPIFWLTDVILPVALMVLWAKLRVRRADVSAG